MTTTRHKLNARTYYLLDDGGCGTIFSTAGDLDAVTDAVAQDIGFPIEAGTWLEPDATMRRLEGLEDNAVFICFAIREDAVEAWKKAKS